MGLETLNETPLSEKDQLLDQLNALDKNKPDYQKEKDTIEKKLHQISQKPEETINSLNLRAEAKLSEVDKFKADQNHQRIDNAKIVDKLLSEIHSIPTNHLADTDTKPQKSSTEQRLVPSIYFNQLDATAEVVKKAIRSFNWRSLRQLSQKEKENLCAQIDKIVTDTQISVNDQYQGNTDVTKISRTINESRYQIQKIADDRHIKIPEEY